MVNLVSFPYCLSPQKLIVLFNLNIGKTWAFYSLQYSICQKYLDFKEETKAEVIG